MTAIIAAGHTRSTLPCRSTCLGVLLLVGCGGWRSDVAVADTDFLAAFPSRPSDSLVTVVIEIPAGTNAKWQVAKDGMGLEWELEDGTPRVIEFLAYPANYGIIPRTLLPASVGGDGDPVDAVLLGPAIDRGSVVAGRPVGMLRLVDTGERDDKVLVVPVTGPMSDVVDLIDLRRRYSGVMQILEIWFTRYKGSDWLVSQGFAERDEANLFIDEAVEHFERAHRRNDTPRPY